MATTETSPAATTPGLPARGLAAGGVQLRHALPVLDRRGPRQRHLRVGRRVPPDDRHDPRRRRERADARERGAHPRQRARGELAQAVLVDDRAIGRADGGAARRVRRQARRPARGPRAAHRRARGGRARADRRTRSSTARARSRSATRSTASMHPYRGPDGSITTLNNSIFSTVPGSPAYVAKADHQRVNIPSTATSGSSRARTRSSPTGRSTTGANDPSLPRPILVGIAAAWAAAIAAQAAGRRRARCTTTRCSRAAARRWRSPRSLVPARVAGDDRGDDAAVEPAARAAVRARIGARAAAAARDGGVPRRLRARLERRSGWRPSAPTRRCTRP